MAKKRVNEFDPGMVRELSVRVYKLRLEADNGKGAVERMIAKDEDNGEKLASRAAAYDKLSRTYLKASDEMQILRRPLVE